MSTQNNNMKKKFHHVTPPVRNSVFGNMPSATLAALEASLPPPAPPVRINMCSTVMHFQPVKHISFIAEGLVAYDPARDAVVKFISLFIPAHDGQKKGKWFKVTSSNVLLPPLPVLGDPTHQPAWLEMEKMPTKPEGLEFRILRGYFNNKHPGKPVFEVLNFDLPEDGIMVNRKTLRVEQVYNSVPLFALRENWWHLLILKYLGRFVGKELITSTDTKAALQRLVASGSISSATMAEILAEDTPSEASVEEAHEEEPILPTVRTVEDGLATHAKDGTTWAAPSPPVKPKEEWQEAGASSKEEYQAFLEEEGEAEPVVPTNPHAAAQEEDEEVLLLDEER